MYKLLLILLLLAGCSKSDSSKEEEIANPTEESPANRTCLYYGSSILASASITGYLSSTVPYGRVCQRITATCDGVTGNLSANPSPYCNVLPPKNCAYYGSVYYVGSSISGYAQATVPYGGTCVPVTATCDGETGTFNLIPEKTCLVTPPKDCIYNGETYKVNEVVSGFEAFSVPFGKTCQTLSAACNGSTGEFDTYPASSCFVEPPKPCLLGTETIASGDSIVAYQYSSGSKFCSEVKQVRECFNGKLSGSYSFLECKENPIVIKIEATAGDTTLVGISRKDTLSGPRISWGDGTYSDVITVNSFYTYPKHTYNQSGEYIIKILGSWSRDILNKPFYVRTQEEGDVQVFAPLVSGSSDGQSYHGVIVEVINWGDNIIDTFSAMFLGQKSLVSLPQSAPNLSLATDMSLMFFNTEKFNQPLNWDTSHIVNMKGVFWHALGYNQLTNWNTSNVNNMKEMFSGAIRFNQPLYFDTSKVLMMTGMFRNAVNFNQDLSSWCVSMIWTKPVDFDTNSSPLWLNSSKPIWGTCPSLP